MELDPMKLFSMFVDVSGAKGADSPEQVSDFQKGLMAQQLGAMVTSAIGNPFGGAGISNLVLGWLPDGPMKEAANWVLNPIGATVGLFQTLVIGDGKKLGNGYALAGDRRLGEAEAAVRLIGEYREAIEGKYDGWFKDGAIGRSELERLAADPEANEEMRKAARFLLDNPDILDLLDKAAGKGFKDGAFGGEDFDAMLAELAAAKNKNASGDAASNATRRDSVDLSDALAEAFETATGGGRATGSSTAARGATADDSPLSLMLAALEGVDDQIRDLTIKMDELRKTGKTEGLEQLAMERARLSQLKQFYGNQVQTLYMELSTQLKMWSDIQRTAIQNMR